MIQTENVWPNTFLVPQAFWALDGVVAPEPGVLAIVVATEIKTIAPIRSTAGSSSVDPREAARVCLRIPSRLRPGSRFLALDKFRLGVIRINNFC